jgi:MIP family channel proteins
MLNKKTFWAVVRLALGLLQMSGATASLIIFTQIGVQPLSIWLCLITLGFTLLSILLFRGLRVHEEKHVDLTSMKKYGAEFIGTFALVFAGTGAIIINDVSDGAVTHVGVALTFGLIVLAMIYAIGDVSGAHLNPAVTLGFFAARRLRGKIVLPYILSQSLGAVAASVLLSALFPQHPNLGTTSPAGAAAQSLILEIVLTTFLMFVILNVSTGPKERGTTAGIAVGSVIALEALFAGPICGASMNPARSFAPALVSQHLSGLWIYLVAPITGAMLAVVACRCVREKGCCSAMPAGRAS